MALPQEELEKQTQLLTEITTQLEEQNKLYKRRTYLNILSFLLIILLICICAGGLVYVLISTG